MSRGATETKQLLQNVQDQLNRLLSQLNDLDEMRDELDEDEYEETKSDTIQQMEEFEASLKKMMQGNMSLVTELGAIQLAIQAAVSDAFHTPEVIKMFASKQPGQLRTRLESLKVNEKLGKISNDTYTQQAIEILSALKKLGEELSGEEEQFLSANMTASLQAFANADNKLGSEAQSNILSSAANQVKNAQQ